MPSIESNQLQAFKSLYNEKEYSTVKIDQYINELIKKLSDSYPQLGSRIRVHVIADTIEFNTEKAVPFSLLLNELITNSLKHAFKEAGYRSN